MPIGKLEELFHGLPLPLLVLLLLLPLSTAWTLLSNHVCVDVWKYTPKACIDLSHRAHTRVKQQQWGISSGSRRCMRLTSRSLCRECRRKMCELVTTLCALRLAFFFVTNNVIGPTPQGVPHKCAADVETQPIKICSLPIPLNSIQVMSKPCMHPIS